MGERVLFTAQDGAKGELYVASPTDEPSPVETLNAFALDRPLVAVGDRSVFAASATRHDIQLWAARSE